MRANVMSELKITKSTPIKELLKNHPEAAEILMSYGLQCVNCHFSEFDTLGDGASMHGMSEKDIRLVIKDVNEVLKK